uniref:Uncharacterized protein n=1 Tax=Pipistrellus kuhlii TaxID=59472 RepID=A0A7J7UTD8_PIPKU|nr:hypothetical protein mPipKuh1_008691 [Pipistrellus kuhlii]
MNLGIGRLWHRLASPWRGGGFGGRRKPAVVKQGAVFLLFSSGSSHPVTPSVSTDLWPSASLWTTVTASSPGGEDTRSDPQGGGPGRRVLHPGWPASQVHTCLLWTQVSAFSAEEGIGRQGIQES